MLAVVQMACSAGLVSLLAERDASLRFLPLWGPGEEAEIQELSRLCPAGSLLLPERMLSCGKWLPASRKRICISAIVPRPGTSP